MLGPWKEEEQINSYRRGMPYAPVLNNIQGTGICPQNREGKVGRKCHGVLLHSAHAGMLGQRLLLIFQGL